jgi:ribosomal protein S20
MEDLKSGMSVEGAAKASDVGRIRNSAGKATIRTTLRKIFDEARDNPPNVNRAWVLLKMLLPDATRSRVREVLKEAEFARRRRGPGRKAKRRPIQLTTVQEIPPAI